jgi:hypothetical protein
MSKQAKSSETLSKSDLVTLAEVLKFLRTEYPAAVRERLEILDISDESWDEVLSRLNNSIS